MRSVVSLVDIAFLLLLIFSFINNSESADPLESLIRNGWLMIRDYGEKMISNIAIPKSSDLPQDVISFQTDPRNEKALSVLTKMMNTCPQSMPLQELQGLWHVTHVSKRLLQTSFYDIHETIEKLSTGKSISSRKSLFSLFKSDTLMRCLQFTVLDNSASSLFELSYFSSENQKKSIIGQISRESPNHLSIHLATILNIPFSIIYTTIVSQSNKIVVLSQTDSIPTPCDNYMVIQSNPSTMSNDFQISQILNAIGANPPSNPMLNQNSCVAEAGGPNSNQKSIIRPASQISRSLYL